MENTVDQSMQLDFFFKTRDFLEGFGVSSNLSFYFDQLIGIAFIVLIAWISDFVSKRIMVAWIERVAKKSVTIWDDIFVEKKLFNHLAHLAPALIFYYSLTHVISNADRAEAFLKGAVVIYMIIVILKVISSFLSGLEDIYQTTEMAKERPIKGFIQIAKIIIIFIGVVLIISVLIGKSPIYLFAGIGTFAAVLMLVFKDTILGFVASIQLSANNMVKIGDWITMPKNNADGIVTEITLNTVKVQNGDKTIATIPTYALIAESFTNWRGMFESGGRRAKRSINIDMNSVAFLTAEQKEKFRKFHLLKEYIDQKEVELSAHNKSLGVDESVVVNGRRMTNLGTFRKYIEVYLANQPMVHKELPMLVRQLQPTESGIPLEIMFFSNDQAWVNYENLQSDIFDHILAVIPEFGLKVFQRPSGSDFRNKFNE